MHGIRGHDLAKRLCTPWGNAFTVSPRTSLLGLSLPTSTCMISEMSLAEMVTGYCRLLCKNRGRFRICLDLNQLLVSREELRVDRYYTLKNEVGLSSKPSNCWSSEIEER